LTVVTPSLNLPSAVTLHPSGPPAYGSPEWQGWVLNEEESLPHILKAYEAGINTFDTADVYSNGDSEVILGKVPYFFLSLSPFLSWQCALKGATLTLPRLAFCVMNQAIKEFNLPRENIVVMTKTFNLVQRTHGEKIEGGRAGNEAAGYVLFPLPYLAPSLA
jgi:hypothetical protein